MAKKEKGQKKVFGFWLGIVLLVLFIINFLDLSFLNKFTDFTELIILLTAIYLIINN